MRLVVCHHIQWDADNLPPHVDASACVPAEEYFAAAKVTRSVSAPAPAVADPPAPKVKRSK
jgi:hypothetical protein